MVQRSRFRSGTRNLAGVTKELKSLWKREVRWHTTVWARRTRCKLKGGSGNGGRGKGEVGYKKESSFKKVNEKPRTGEDRAGELRSKGREENAG